MTKDQSYGALILVVSVAVALLYLYGIYAGFTLILIEIPVVLAVLAILGITGWIGWTMATTPPPAPLETELASATTSGSGSTTNQARTTEHEEK
jgi:predicted DNA-binding transcriptional regulator